MIEECYTYTIMPDFGNAAYGWVITPGEIRRGVGGNMADYTGWCGDHSISKQLEHDFAEWSLEFEKNVDVYGNAPDFDWENYHKRGLALARKLKSELGSEIRVRYVKPCEDPGSETNTCTEILLDFAPPKSVSVPLTLDGLPDSYRPKAKELEYIDASDGNESAVLCYFYALAGNTYSPGWILNRISDDIILKTEHVDIHGKESFTEYFTSEWHKTSSSYIRKLYELARDQNTGNLFVIEHSKQEVTDCGIGRQTQRIEIEANNNGLFKIISVITIAEPPIAPVISGSFPGIEDESIQYKFSYKPKSISIIAGYDYPCAYGEHGDGDVLTAYFSDIPHIIDIEAAFKKWADWYDTQKDVLTAFPWKEFNRQGIELAKRLYQAIKHTGFEVSYWQSCQEPGVDPFQKIPISDETL